MEWKDLQCGGIDCQSEEEFTKCRFGKGLCSSGRFVWPCDFIAGIELLPYRGLRLCAHTGDCAELFDYCNQEMIEAKVKLLLQMSLILIWGKHTLKMHMGGWTGLISPQEPTNPWSV